MKESNAVTSAHQVVSREEWLEARRAHLAREKALTRQRDELNRQRRELPWFKVEKDYVFEGARGRQTLDLHLVPAWLDGREVLAVFRDPGDPHPGYFIELTAAAAGQIAAIRDFRYVPYIAADAAFTLAGAAPGQAS